MCRLTGLVIARLRTGDKGSSLGNGCWEVTEVEEVPFHMAVVQNSNN